MKIKSEKQPSEGNTAKILAVDDDQNVLKILKMRLDAEGYKVTAISSGKGALEIMKDEDFDLALLDLKIAQENGIELMETMHSIDSEMPIIILTAYGTIESAVEAMRKGAYSYLTKPFEHHQLSLQIKNGIEKAGYSREVKRLKGIVRQKYVFKNIIGESEKMKRVLELVSRAAKIDSNVYIQGESGTGKELIAKALHLASQRKDGPMVAINCAAIPESLLEAELFGFKKGAFTGAVYTRKGLFEQANKGSIFLDEISEMSAAMQSKLLRVLEEKKFYPIGSEKPSQVDFRIIAASNRDLEEAIERGDFRSDLFYRIHVIPIKLPPLRERMEDIPLLAEHFLREFSQKMGKEIRGFSPSVLEKLLLHSWPGNARELENAVECAVAMSTGDFITEDLIFPAEKRSKTTPKPLKEAKVDFEKQYIIEVLELAGGNVTRAAKLASKYRADFYKLMKKYGLKTEDFRRNI